MTGSFIVLTQRGPFSRNLLTYDLSSLEALPKPGTWFLVPFVHGIAPGLLIAVSEQEQSLHETGREGTILPVLGFCDAPGVYPQFGESVSLISRALERQMLGWDDALGIVRFLQSLQRHAVQHARLSVSNQRILLQNLQLMAGQDASFAAHTKDIRGLLIELESGATLPKLLRKLSVASRRSLFEDGLIVNQTLADGTASATSGGQEIIDHGQEVVTGSFQHRLERVRAAARSALSRSSSVALMVSSEILADLYENAFAEEQGMQVIRWPSASRKVGGDGRSTTVWLSTRQFSASLLPEIGLIVVDLGIPGEWAFFWQRFSLRSLVAIAHDMSRIKGIPCLIGGSVPTLSLLDAADISTESLLPLPANATSEPSPAFVLRTQAAAGTMPSGPSRILLDQTMALLRHTSDLGRSSMLLLNIRGLATIIECAECGYTATCPVCGTTLTLTADRTRLFCKQCGYSEPSPDVCPNCHGTQLRSRGYGLDRLARELRHTFPEAWIHIMKAEETGNPLSQDGPRLYLGTYADAQHIAALKPELVVFPDVSVGLRHPVFDNIEQLVAVVRGAVVETLPGNVLVQLDRRSLGLRNLLDGHEPMARFLENESRQRQELLMPPFARQFVIRIPFGRSMPDAGTIAQTTTEALQSEGVQPLGLHADLLAVSTRAKVVSIEFRADAATAALELRVSAAFAHSKVFQNATIRVY